MEPRINVAGRDRTGELLSRLDAIASRHPAPPYWDAAAQRRTAPQLAACADEAEYADCLLRLLRNREHLVTADFEVAHRNSTAGRLMARLKSGLWKLLRYQHDYMSGQQNDVNFAMGSALEFEHDLNRRRLQQLEERLATLERRLGAEERDA